MKISDFAVAGKVGQRREREGWVDEMERADQELLLE